MKLIVEHAALAAAASTPTSDVSKSVTWPAPAHCLATVSPTTATQPCSWNWTTPERTRK